MADSKCDVHTLGNPHPYHNRRRTLCLFGNCCAGCERSGKTALLTVFLLPRLVAGSLEHPGKTANRSLPSHCHDSLLARPNTLARPRAVQCLPTVTNRCWLARTPWQGRGPLTAFPMSRIVAGSLEHSDKTARCSLSSHCHDSLLTHLVPQLTLAIQTTVAGLWKRSLKATFNGKPCERFDRHAAAYRTAGRSGYLYGEAVTVWLASKTTKGDKQRLAVATKRPRATIKRSTAARTACGRLGRPSAVNTDSNGYWTTRI